MTTKLFVKFGGTSLTSLTTPAGRPESYNEGALPNDVCDPMRTHTPGLTFLILLACLATGVTQAAQQTPPPKPAPDQPPITFKVEVNYVEIDAIVTDEQGNFVRNLTKDDFVVTEQGKPQSVSIASLVDIPVEKFDPPLFKTKVVEPDVRSNSKAFNGRVFVLVLDDLNTSFSRSARVKLAARQFIEQYLGANDVAAIVQTGGAKSTGQEFTSSHDRLLRAVNSFMGQKERSATLGSTNTTGRRESARADAPATRTRKFVSTRRGIPTAFSRTSLTTCPESAAGARPSSSSAKASTTTSTSRLRTRTRATSASTAKTRSLPPRAGTSASTASIRGDWPVSTMPQR